MFLPLAVLKALNVRVTASYVYIDAVVVCWSNPFAALPPVMMVPWLAVVLLPAFCHMPHIDLLSSPTDKVALGLVVTLLVINRYFRLPIT